MRIVTLAAIVSLTLPAYLTAQETTATPANAVPMAADSSIILPRDTPVELIATREITTASSAAGTQFSMQVNKPVIINGIKVIPFGAKAIGEVTSASGSAALGKSGKMTTKILYLELGGTHIPLEGGVSAKGTGAGSMALPGIAAVLTLNPLLLLHRGNSAKIKAGETVTVFVSTDMAFDLSGPEPKQVPLPETAVQMPKAAPTEPAVQ